MDRNMLTIQAMAIQMTTPDYSKVVVIFVC
jgi:hypothetical protein